ncbi:MAG: NAD(P)/FAD-dependent oxidoreductase [Desulfurococcales archaeon]|nr:NAD(P)/FAD-dependent oxidoreductase [Desulfurococcales archaeon]
MVEADYMVVGAGPAGISAGLKLTMEGFSVKIYEAAPKLAMKPCGWGIPLPQTLPFRIPEESIKKHIDGATLFIDREHALDYTGNDLGVIVDKPLMLEILANQYGVDILYKAPVNPRRIKSETDVRRLIIAGGFPWYMGETINAVQFHLKTAYSWGEMFEFYFDSEIIGYYWIFPMEKHLVKIGVGGFKDMVAMKNLLERFVMRDERLRGSQQVSKLEGARLAVGGIHLHESYPLIIGEASGAVYPLTGEGIRPSIIMGYAVAEALAEGKNPFKAVRQTNVYWKVSLQRRILEKVKQLTSKSRADFLKNLNPEVLIRVGLGDFTKTSLLKLIIKSPKCLASILRKFI